MEDVSIAKISCCEFKEESEIEKERHIEADLVLCRVHGQTKEVLELNVTQIQG